MRRTATLLVLALLLALAGAGPVAAADPVEDATLEVRSLQARVARAATDACTST